MRFGALRCISALTKATYADSEASKKICEFWMAQPVQALHLIFSPIVIPSSHPVAGDGTQRPKGDHLAG